MRALFETLTRGELVKVEESQVPLLCLSDCRSLYDHVHRQGVPRIPSDRRLAVDLAALRQALRAEQWDEKLPLAWLPSSFQLADILTKPKDPAEWWATFQSRLLVPISLTGVAPATKRGGERMTSVKPNDGGSGQFIIPSVFEFSVV